MDTREKVLVTGANGQLGSELVAALSELHGADRVLATDIVAPLTTGKTPFRLLNVLDQPQLQALVASEKVTRIYHLAAILSARGENSPQMAWQVNMQGLLNVLETAREQKLNKVYWPSSIATFGANTPAENTPQHTVTEPATVYGISKHAGELWCQYYHKQFGLDVRSLRYPGLIGYKALPGGGTTDYAVDIFHKAISGEVYECFLHQYTRLPMMYMEDAVRATIELMEANAESITIRTSYNIHGMSFTPGELAACIRQYAPGLQVRYQPDYRQKIADGWPQSIDDSAARGDWNWQPAYDLPKLVQTMWQGLLNQVKEPVQ
mgnify:CR=1 FL=1